MKTFFLYFIIIGGIFAIHFSNYIADILIAQQPYLYPLETSTAGKILLGSNIQITQTFTLHDTPLSNILIPYEVSNGSIPEGVIINVSQNSTSAWFLISANELIAATMFSLNLSAHKFTTTSPINLTIQIQSKQASNSVKIILFQAPNPWLLPHRYPGRLTINNQIQSASLVFKPVIENEKSMAYYIKYFDEVSYTFSQKPHQAILVVIIAFCVGVLIYIPLSPIQKFPPMTQIKIILIAAILFSFYFAFRTARS